MFIEAHDSKTGAGMGVLRDVTGDYRAGFAVVAAGYLLALGVVLLLRRHVGRRGAA